MENLSFLFEHGEDDLLAAAAADFPMNSDLSTIFMDNGQFDFDTRPPAVSFSSARSSISSGLDDEAPITPVTKRNLAVCSGSLVIPPPSLMAPSSAWNKSVPPPPMTHPAAPDGVDAYIVNYFTSPVFTSPGLGNCSAPMPPINSSLVQNSNQSSRLLVFPHQLLQDVGLSGESLEGDLGVVTRARKRKSRNHGEFDLYASDGVYKRARNKDSLEAENLMLKSNIKEEMMSTEALIQSYEDKLGTLKCRLEELAELELSILTKEGGLVTNSDNDFSYCNFGIDSDCSPLSPKFASPATDNLNDEEAMLLQSAAACFIDAEPQEEEDVGTRCPTLPLQPEFSKFPSSESEKVNKVPAPTSSRNSHNGGRWTKEEHKVFLESLKKWGRNWERVSSQIGTRNIVQVRSHAQKFFKKLAKKKAMDAVDAAKAAGLSEEAQKMAAYKAAIAIDVSTSQHGLGTKRKAKPVDFDL